MKALTSTGLKESNTESIWVNKFYDFVDGREFENCEIYPYKI